MDVKGKNLIGRIHGIWETSDGFVFVKIVTPNRTSNYVSVVELDGLERDKIAASFTKDEAAYLTGYLSAKGYGDSWYW